MPPTKKTESTKRTFPVPGRHDAKTRTWINLTAKSPGSQEFENPKDVDWTYMSTCGSKSLQTAGKTYQTIPNQTSKPSLWYFDIFGPISSQDTTCDFANPIAACCILLLVWLTSWPSCLIQALPAPSSRRHIWRSMARWGKVGLSSILLLLHLSSTGSWRYLEEAYRVFHSRQPPKQ